MKPTTQPPTLRIAGGTHASQSVQQKIPRSLCMEEILAIQPADTIIKGRLPGTGLVFIYGPPKSGKTFFALDMSMSLARGEPWHGIPTRETGVLYIAGEGVHGLGMRMLAYSRKHGHKPRTKFRVVPAAVTLHESVQGIEEEMKAIEIEEGWRPRVLVLDTLARTKGDLDENTGDMAHWGLRAKRAGLLFVVLGGAVGWCCWVVLLGGGVGGVVLGGVVLLVLLVLFCWCVVLGGVVLLVVW